MQKQNLFQRRILPALLALCMTLSLLPGTALAAQPVAEPAVYSSAAAAPRGQSPATWRFLFVILKRNNITYRDPEGKTQKETNRMSAAEVNAIKFAAKDFKKFFEKEVGNLVKPVVETIEIDTPVTELSGSGWTNDTSLWIDPEDCYPLIRSKVDINKYDQIFAVANLNSIKTFYLGLTTLGGFFQRTGYSFINTMDKDSCLKRYSTSNPFPSGVPVHEFLHTMEYWTENRTGKKPETALHDAGTSGYAEPFYDYYADYANKKVVSSTGTMSGIDPAAWAVPPVSARKGGKTIKIDLWDADRKQNLGQVTATSGKPCGTLPTPTRNGYTFVGWFTAATGGVQIKSSDTIQLAADQIWLYARWKPKAGSNIYTVTLDQVAGAIPTKAETKTVEYGKTYGELPELKRDNYTFSGWYTSKTGGKKVTAATKVTTKKDHTLYARWTKNASLTLTLNANGGNFHDDAKTKTATVTKGADYGDLETPVRFGYTFAGWYTSKTGGKKIAADTVVTASGKQTLYAHWAKGRTFQVVFDANGGNVLQEYKAVVYSRSYGTLPTPVRPGYHFGGWWTKKTGGVRIRPEAKVEITAKQTLYARWTEGPVAVQKRQNGSWKVSIPVGWKVYLYDKETDANISGVLPAWPWTYSIDCNQKVELSNGAVRYYSTAYKGWLDYTMEMDMT